MGKMTVEKCSVTLPKLKKFDQEEDFQKNIFRLTGIKIMSV